MNRSKTMRNCIRMKVLTELKEKNRYNNLGVPLTKKNSFKKS